LCVSKSVGECDVGKTAVVLQAPASVTYFMFSEFFHYLQYIWKPCQLVSNFTLLCTLWVDFGLFYELDDLAFELWKRCCRDQLLKERRDSACCTTVSVLIDLSDITRRQINLITWLISSGQSLKPIQT